MSWGFVMLLVTALLGLPLSVSLTGTTAALSGVAGLLALDGWLTRASPVFLAVVLVSLVEEFVALLQAG